MPSRIRWAVTALTDLRELRSYVAHDDPAAARRLAAAIRRAVEALPENPHIGRLGPELPGRGRREVIVALPDRVRRLRAQQHDRRPAGVARPARPDQPCGSELPDRRLLAGAARMARTPPRTKKARVAAGLMNRGASDAAPGEWS